MKQRFRKILVNLLMLAIVVLPVPSVFSMSADMSVPDSGNHCAEAMMEHAGHDMTTDDVADNDTVSCKCCGQCDGDCMGCTTMSAITFELFQLSDATSGEIYPGTLQSFLTRSTSPPSRPPLSL